MVRLSGIFENDADEEIVAKKIVESCLSYLTGQELCSSSVTIVI